MAFVHKTYYQNIFHKISTTFCMLFSNRILQTVHWDTLNRSKFTLINDKFKITRLWEFSQMNPLTIQIRALKRDFISFWRGGESNCILIVQHIYLIQYGKIVSKRHQNKVSKKSLKKLVFKKMTFIVMEETVAYIHNSTLILFY